MFCCICNKTLVEADAGQKAVLLKSHERGSWSSLEHAWGFPNLRVVIFPSQVSISPLFLTRELGVNGALQKQIFVDTALSHRIGPQNEKPYNREDGTMKVINKCSLRSVTSGLMAGLLCVLTVPDQQAQIALGGGGGASLAGAATLAGATQVA